MPRQPPTKPGTPRLSEIARHVVVPAGVVSTGWPSVRDKCTELGISFRWWQSRAGQVILAKRADGKYAATIGGTGLSIPRQVGKTFLVAAIVFALCLLRPGLTVIWTAHRLRTAEETFGKMQVFAKRRRIAPHVLKIILGSGEEEIRFRNGSRILFGARERGFGRGFDEVDVLIFDEGQILKDSALDDMIPAANQSRQDTGVLLLFMGTPPKPEDPSEAFTRMRTEALSGEDSDTGWVEFGADPDFRPTALPAPLKTADWKQVAKANPSFPDDTPRESILRMRKKLGDASFLREGLGIWLKGQAVDPRMASLRLRWPGLKVTADSGAPPQCGFGVDVSPDWAVASIAAAGLRVDGRRLMWLVGMQRGTGWILPKLIELRDSKGLQRVSVDTRSSTAALIPQIEAAGIEVEPVTTPGMGKAFGQLLEASQTGELAHLDDPILNAALAGAELKDVGSEGACVLTRKGAGNISPLVAGTLAFAGSYDIAPAFFAAWR